jgi:dimethylaniline monooxygenase (N-oxide forming)
MWADIRKKEEEMRMRYYATQRHTIQIDFIPFMDELAELIGCKPNLREYLRSNCSILVNTCDLHDAGQRQYNVVLFCLCSSAVAD